VSYESQEEADYFEGHSEENELAYEVERLAKELHGWYLEATKTMNPESYNSNAQKSYEDLTEQQRGIDRFIAEKILTIQFKGGLVK